MYWNISIGKSVWKKYKNSFYTFLQHSKDAKILSRIKMLKKEKDIDLGPDCPCLTHRYEIITLSSVMEWAVFPSSSYVHVLTVPSTSECDWFWR